jgi:hypothetical protein
MASEAVANGSPGTKVPIRRLFRTSTTSSPLVSTGKIRYGHDNHHSLLININLNI